MASITFRTDPAVDQALRELTEGGVERSEAIRRAVIETANRHRLDRLRAQAEALASDPDDLAEMHAVQADIAAIRAW
jgi:Arc/MetJ-type ribon-helix-helix transcriptional regulator